MTVPYVKFSGAKSSILRATVLSEYTYIPMNIYRHAIVLCQNDVAIFLQPCISVVTFLFNFMSEEGLSAIVNCNLHQAITNNDTSLYKFGWMDRKRTNDEYGGTMKANASEWLSDIVSGGN